MFKITNLVLNNSLEWRIDHFKPNKYWREIFLEFIYNGIRQTLNGFSLKYLKQIAKPLAIKKIHTEQKLIRNPTTDSFTLSEHISTWAKYHWYYQSSQNCQCSILIYYATWVIYFSSLVKVERRSKIFLGNKKYIQW